MSSDRLPTESAVSEMVQRWSTERGLSTRRAAKVFGLTHNTYYRAATDLGGMSVATYRALLLGMGYFL